MKKKFIYLSIISGILFILVLGLFPTKARKLNSMWRATLNSKQGFITHDTTLQEGDVISKVFVEYEYETRSDGFYYKKQPIILKMMEPKRLLPGYSKPNNFFPF